MLPPMRRRGIALIAALVLIGFLFVAVFPIRTYFAQRSALNATEKRLQVLTEQNRKLSSLAAELRSDAEIERLAREHYNLVRPGEEAYAILPPPPPAETDKPPR